MCHGSGLSISTRTVETCHDPNDRLSVQIGRAFVNYHRSLFSGQKNAPGESTPGASRCRQGDTGKLTAFYSGLYKLCTLFGAEITDANILFVR